MPKRAVLLVNLGSPDSPSVPDVRKYLRKWIASVATTTAAQPGAAARKQRLARIHVEAGKLPGGLGRVHEYTHGRFGTPSLAELSAGQLDEVVRHFNF